MNDNTIVLLLRTWQEAGHINQSYDGDVERITEPDKTSGFSGSINIQHAGQIFRLIGNDTHAHTVKFGKAYHNVLGIAAMHFQELSIISNAVNDVFNVVRNLWVFRDDIVQLVVQAINGIVGRGEGSFLQIVLGDVAHQLANKQQAFFFVFEHKVGYPGFCSVYIRAAKLVNSDVLAGYRFCHFRAGNKHITGVFHHHGEIGEGRRVYRATCTGTKNSGDLRYNPGCFNIFLEHVSVPG